jgi:predicted Ser/Thr protein kinase
MAEILDIYNQSLDSVRDDYQTRRGVMSFAEYLADFASRPQLHLRDAARYLLDAIDFFGSEQVDTPWGKVTRLKVFNQEFADKDLRLVGQEATQGAVRDSLAAQVRDGRVNRLIVVHGPNGSAKSTLMGNLFQGLETYSRKDEGALFRFRWVFPTRKSSQGSVGFGSRGRPLEADSYAHLSDEDLDATLECEIRDHPLLLLPRAQREKLIDTALAGRSWLLPDHFVQASLCHRCRQIADALMRTHNGDLRKVLAHVQVERWAMSRRYRRGLVQVGPQVSADAGQRQITADRNLSALPIELQNMTLFETYGPLVDGSGGIVEFEDMLKRPLDAFKYLLGSVETGELLLGQSILRLNSVLMATTNDDMLEAFREHHEYISFRERLTLIPVPYITRYSVEKQIYELQLVPNIGRHVAPHAVESAAQWAVLTRLEKPDSSHYSDDIKEAVHRLTAVEKADLYDSGTAPRWMSSEVSTVLRGKLKEIRAEGSGSWAYEGRFGASPRLVRAILLHASLSEKHDCLSPFAVLDEIRIVCKKKKENPFLDRDSEAGNYHDPAGYVDVLLDRVLDKIEEDTRTASGLVEEAKYLELMDKYVTHVSHLAKGEKVYNESKGIYEAPDESIMKRVESTVGFKGEAAEFRREFMNRIAAWAIEHPRQKLRVDQIFPDYLQRLKDAYFEEHRQKVAKIAKLALIELREPENKLDQRQKQQAQNLIERMVAERGYCPSCIKDGLAVLISRRFSDI